MTKDGGGSRMSCRECHGLEKEKKQKIYRGKKEEDAQTYMLSAEP